MKSCAEETVEPQQAILVGAVAAAVVLGWVAKHKLQHAAISAVAINVLVGISRSRGQWYYYVGQPVGLCLLAAILYNNHGRAADVFGACYVITVAVITAAVDPCTSSLWIYAPDAVGVVYLVAGVATFYGAEYPAWCLVEAATLAVLLARADSTEVVLRAEHLTWWSIMLFGAWDAAIFCEYYANRNIDTHAVDIVPNFTPAVLTLSSIVLVGVYYMSAAGCDLLSDALDEAGVELYLLGNFAMHYYPVLRSLFGRSSHSAASMAKGGAIAVLYAIAYPATDVYGCSHPAPEYTTSLIAGVALLLAALYGIVLTIKTNPPQKTWQRFLHLRVIKFVQS